MMKSARNGDGARAEAELSEFWGFPKGWRSDFKLSAGGEAGRHVESALGRSSDAGSGGGAARCQPSGGGGALRGERGEREPLAGAGARDRATSRPGPLGGDRRSGRIEAQAPLILALLAATPDTTIEELRAALAERGHALRLRHAAAVLRPPPHHAQKKTAHASEQDRPDVLKRRQAWFDAQPDLDPERLVFIDETWAKTNMARTHGRAPRGERLRVGVPHGHWKTTTFVAGLTLRGMIAPFVLSTARSTATPSRPMSSRSSSPSCAPATSSSWTISPATRGRASAR